jgi:hypothetical protein
MTLRERVIAVENAVIASMREPAETVDRVPLVMHAAVRAYTAAGRAEDEALADLWALWSGAIGGDDAMVALGASRIERVLKVAA